MRSTILEELKHIFEFIQRDPSLLNKSFEEVYKHIYWYKFKSPEDIVIAEQKLSHSKESRKEYQVRLKRAEVMKNLYEKGKTLNEVGLKYNLSRERIRQIIVQFFPGFEFRHSHEGAGFHKICANPKCRKPFISTGWDAKYCSRICVHMIKRKYHTAEEIRQANATRTRNWYNKHKDDPAFKEKVHQYNMTQKKNLKLRKEGKL